MIQPSERIPKRFDLWRIEAAIMSSRKPSVPKYRVVKTAAERSQIGTRAGWAKRAKILAEGL